MSSYLNFYWMQREWIACLNWVWIEASLQQLNHDFSKPLLHFSTMIRGSWWWQCSCAYGALVCQLICCTELLRSDATNRSRIKLGTLFVSLSSGRFRWINCETTADTLIWTKQIERFLSFFRPCGFLSCRFLSSLSTHLDTRSQMHRKQWLTSIQLALECSSSGCWLKRTPTYKSFPFGKIRPINANSATTVSARDFIVTRHDQQQAFSRFAIHARVAARVSQSRQLFQSRSEQDKSHRAVKIFPPPLKAFKCTSQAFKV